MSRVLSGVVVSIKMDKTIVVEIKRLKTHPIYKKQYKVTTKFMAHDADGQAQLGDKVQIRETRPLSRHKKFTLDKITKSVEVAK